MKKVYIRNVSHSFKDLKVLRNIDLEFEPCKFYAIMGSSGSGKTTFLNIMSGLLKPTSGTVNYDGEVITDMKTSELTDFRVNNISFVFQDYSLIEHLNVKENIQFTKRISRQKIEKERYEEILNAVGLNGKENEMPANLSGGQKQRVAVARALLSDGSVIFADEPTGALDLSTRGSILKLLREAVTKYNKTVIMVTHDPEAAAVANEVMFLHEGKLDETIRSEITSKNIANKLISLESRIIGL